MKRWWLYSATKGEEALMDGVHWRNVAAMCLNSNIQEASLQRSNGLNVWDIPEEQAGGYVKFKGEVWMGVK